MTMTELDEAVIEMQEFIAEAEAYLRLRYLEEPDNEDIKYALQGMNIHICKGGNA